MKRKLFILFSVMVVTMPLLTSQASARMWDSIECQPGFYWKKGGWTTGGYSKSGGYCIPMHVGWWK
jgi:hypothetical protein